MHACIFQSVIFTFCGREGVKWILLYRLSWCWSTWNFSQSFVTCGRLSSMNRQSLDDNPYGRCEGETKLTFGNTGVWQYWNSLIMTLLQQSPALNTSVYHWAMARSEVLYIQVLILNARNYIYIYMRTTNFSQSRRLKLGHVHDSGNYRQTDRQTDTKTTETERQRERDFRL